MDRLPTERFKRYVVKGKLDLVGKYIYKCNNLFSARIPIYCENYIELNLFQVLANLKTSAKKIIEEYLNKFTISSEHGIIKESGAFSDKIGRKLLLKLLTIMWAENCFF